VGRVFLATAALAAAGILLAAAADGAGSTAESPSLEAYSGLGAWISIYDTRSWRDPERVIDTLVAHGVHTLFLETSNYRQRVDIVRPQGVGAFLGAAHAQGIDVVAWYLPSLADVQRDLRRSLAAVNFVSADGESFDSFALDVEATVVRSFATRNARTLQLATQLGRSVPADYPLGAITIAPVGASPTYWPTFPFRGLSRVVDVFLPMAYFTARTRGAKNVRAYTAANVAVIRSESVDPDFPIHPIGGVTPHATPAEVRAFVRAAADCGALGAGLWELERTTASEWAQLAPAASFADAPVEAADALAPIC
jgi:hypothetical protein